MEDSASANISCLLSSEPELWQSLRMTVPGYPTWLMDAQTPSRRYDVSNDHTLTANDPLVVEISIIRTYQPANCLPFLLALGLN